MRDGRVRGARGAVGNHRSNVNAGYTQLSVRTERRDDRVVVRVSGDLDHDSAPAVQAALEPDTANGIRQFDLDLSGVTFIDSGALQVFIAAHRALQELGGGLHVVAASPVVARILDLTRLGEMFGG